MKTGKSAQEIRAQYEKLKKTRRRLTVVLLTFAACFLVCHEAAPPVYPMRSVSMVFLLPVPVCAVWIFLVHRCPVCGIFWSTRRRTPAVCPFCHTDFATGKTPD